MARLGSDNGAAEQFWKDKGSRSTGLGNLQAVKIEAGRGERKEVRSNF